MPVEGSYTPKFKVGQTVIVNDTEDPTWNGMECIIFATFRSLEDFSKIKTPCPREYDESEPNKVMYAGWNVDTLNYYWIFEYHAERYCSNSNRGKKILLGTKAVDYITVWFDFSNEGINKFQTMLEHQPPEDGGVCQTI